MLDLARFRQEIEAVEDDEVRMRKDDMLAIVQRLIAGDAAQAALVNIGTLARLALSAS